VQENNAQVISKYLPETMLWWQKKDMFITGKFWPIHKIKNFIKRSERIRQMLKNTKLFEVCLEFTCERISVKLQITLQISTG
jgi:hypothetical protein